MMGFPGVVRASAVLSLAILIVAAPGRVMAQTPIPMDTPIVSMWLDPSDTEVGVGQHVSLVARAMLGDTAGSTVMLGGGGSGSNGIWGVTFGPGINVSTCGTGAVMFTSQNFEVDNTGAFHAVWSPGSPNTLKADGMMTLPTAAAGASIAGTLQCVNGATVGSLSAFFNATQYDGTYTFGAGSGEIAVVGIKWTSSNPAVATVDQSGGVTAISTGDATITATFLNRCWLPTPGVTNPCRGTTTASATVHVTENGGGGGGCATVTFTLLPNSIPATEIGVTIVDPSTGTDVTSFVAPVGEPIEAPEGKFHLRLSAPSGQTVTPVQHGLHVKCGDAEVVRVKFR